MTLNALTPLVRLAVYRKGREPLFQSESSLDWYVRKNRQALIEAGALVMHAGQWHAHSEKFDRFILRAGKAAAKLRAAAEIDSRGIKHQAALELGNVPA